MADYTLDKRVALISVNNPPVNALSYHVRKGIIQALERAREDDNVEAVIIHGTGRTFPAGADINEFASQNAVKEPHLLTVCEVLDEFPKPVISVIHGTALGGGLELCLSTHYRLASETAKIGFPEVHLGLLPGASGTQKLPRLIPLDSAIEIIVSGRHVKASEAYSLGIIDRLIDGNIINKAIEFAQTVIGRPVEPRRVSCMSIKGIEQAQIIFDVARRRVASRSRGAIAPLMCIKAIQAAVEQPTYAKGLQREGELMEFLLTSGQAKAQQYAFFAERNVSKWALPGGINYKTTTPLSIKTAAVIGAGTMGVGIAMSLLSNGISVYLTEQNKELLDRGVNNIRGLILTDVKRKRITEAQAKSLLLSLTPVLDYKSLCHVDLVIEAVFENMEIKKKVFKKLDAVCKTSTIFTSNTSSLNIDEIASVTCRPEKVIGMHFFSPAHVMRLLENIYGKKTSPETIATVMQLGKTLQKLSVLVGNCHGFVGNRMMDPYFSEAGFLLEEGCFPHQVDHALKDFGFAMGIFEVSDLAGIDIGYKMRKELGLVGSPMDECFRQGQRYSPLADTLFEAGRIGQKSGKGWYNYGKPGGRIGARDKDVEDMIIRFSQKHSKTRRTISPQEIVERCLYSMINEGFKILDEGIASKNEEIDIIWIYGYGWPRHMGGPMYYANSMVGLAKIYDRVCHYNSIYKDSRHWIPSALLKKMATQQSVSKL